MDQDGYLKISGDCMTDSFFTQGSLHKMCQDYAIHGPDFAIISDGCSAAIDSDFGARFLVRAAIQNLKHELGSDKFYYSTLAMAYSYCLTLGLSPDCLFATLVVAQKADDKIFVSMKGDGLVAAKYKNGKIRVIYLEFPSSAPFFLRYHLDDESIENYKNQIGGKYTIHEFNDTWTTTQKQVNFNAPSSELFIFDANEVEAVAIMSDGILSFARQEITMTQKQTIRIDEMNVIPELMAFKDFRGEFVQRRCKMAFRQFEKLGWKPTDDFSIGVVT